MANTADMFKQLAGKKREESGEVVVPSKATLEAHAAAAGRKMTQEELERLMHNCMPGMDSDYCPK